MARERAVGLKDETWLEKQLANRPMTATSGNVASWACWTGIRSTALTTGPRRPGRQALNDKGRCLFRFLASLMTRDSYGSVTVRLEAGMATRVATATTRAWEYRGPPDHASSSSGSVSDRPAVGMLLGDPASHEPDGNG